MKRLFIGLFLVGLTWGNMLCAQYFSDNSTGTTIYYERYYYGYDYDTPMVQVVQNYSAEEGPSYSGNVVIPSTVSYQGTTYLVVAIDGYAFRGCTGLTSLTIPPMVRYIDNNAVAGCTNLNTVYFNARNCFCYGSLVSENTALTTVVIGDSVQKIPDGFLSPYNAFDYYDDGCFCGITSITIPNSVDSIGRNAFVRCKNLTSITIPESVKYIDDGAFYGCTSLSTLRFNAISCNMDTRSLSPFVSEEGTNLAQVVIGDRVQRIPDSFLNHPSDIHSNSRLTSIVIPNSVTYIGSHAFRGCSGLANVSLPNTLAKIGPGAYAGCTSLASITIPDAVDTLFDGVFYGCTNLSSVTVPNSVVAIGAYAFSYCTSLRKVNIGQVVRTIWDNAFADCALLDTIVCKPSTPPAIQENTFKNVGQYTTIIIPCGKTEWYSTADYWSFFHNFIEDCDGVTDVELDKVNVYPNPTMSGVTIEGSEVQEVEVVDLQGRVLQRSASSHIDLSSHPSGTYLLRITTADGVAVRRVVKQ